MRVIIPTVQHTGTLFLRHMFGKAGFEELTLNQKPTKKRCVHCDHLMPDKMKRIEELMRRYPTVIPLRHPWRVIWAWHERKRNIRELIAQVERLNYVKRKYHPLCFPIDIDEREIYLGSINAALGIALKTDWKPTNTRSKSYELDPESIEPLVTDRHKNFFRASIFSIYYDL